MKIALSDLFPLLWQGGHHLLCRGVPRNLLVRPRASGGVLPQGQLPGEQLGHDVEDNEENDEKNQPSDVEGLLLR